MTTKQQSGFGVVPIILIIVAVAVLGFVGYKVYTAQSSKPATTNNVTANNQTSPATNQPSSTQTSVAPAAQTDPNAGYVVIKEWGVRFKPVSGLNNVIYAAGPTTAALNFSTADLQALDANCSPEKVPALGGIERDTTPYNDPQGPHPQSLGTIGNYYYYYISPSSPCSDSKSTEDAETKTVALFKESILSLEAAK